MHKLFDMNLRKLPRHHGDIYVIVKRKLSNGDTFLLQVHQSRSQSENRRIARERLQQHLDEYYNKENSFARQEQREQLRKDVEREKKAKRRNELKKAFKQREGLD